ncbi:MAG: dermonecrotic toxin domain-containing protein, partial [Pseudomonas sp.]
MLQTYVNAAGVQFVRDLLKHVPRPDHEATRCIGEWAARQGLQLDPEQTDVVTLHYRGQQAVIVNRMSLTQALVSNWQGESDNNLIGSLIGEPWAGHLPEGTFDIVNALPEHNVLEPGAAYSVFNGLFRRTDPVQIDATTHVPVDAEALQRFIWDLDFHAHYKTLLDDYWAQHLQDHRLAAKINFIAA